jgi:hypothetical protein
MRGSGYRFLIVNVFRPRESTQKCISLCAVFSGSFWPAAVSSKLLWLAEPLTEASKDDDVA